MIGGVVEDIVTGIKPYDALIYLDSEHNGLAHIFKVSGRFVRDVYMYVKANKRIKTRALDVNEDGMHPKLSLKAVKTNKARSIRKHRFVHELPQMNVGSTSLAEHLNQWIEEVTK